MIFLIHIIGENLFKGYLRNVKSVHFIQLCGVKLYSVMWKFFIHINDWEFYSFRAEILFKYMKKIGVYSVIWKEYGSVICYTLVAVFYSWCGDNDEYRYVLAEWINGSKRQFDWLNKERAQQTVIIAHSGGSSGLCPNLRHRQDEWQNATAVNKKRLYTQRLGKSKHNSKTKMACVMTASAQTIKNISE